MRSVALALPDALEANDPVALRTALDPARVRGAIGRLVGADEDKISVSVERTHFSAKRAVAVQYRVCGTDGNAGKAVLAELIGGNAEAYAAELVSQLSKRRRGQIAKGTVPAVTAEPELGLVFRRAGLDAKLPGLKLLYDPVVAVEAVAQAADIPVRRLSVTPTLRAHRLGKRAVLQMDLGGSGKGRVFVRLRPVTSDSGAVAYERHCEIAAALSGAPGIAVPRPLHHDPELGASFFTALPGHAPRFRQIEGVHAAKAIAGALASILSLGPEIAAPYTMDEELAMLGAWIDRICNVFPNLAEAAIEGLDVVERGFAGTEIAAIDSRPRPSHRDFHEGQILMHGDRVGVLDFDTYRLADPGLDIGNLVAHLRMCGFREGRSLAAVEDAFRNTLLGFACREAIEGWTRAALLRLGCIYAFTSERGKLTRALFREAAK